MSLRIVQRRKDKIESSGIRIVAKQHAGRKIQPCQISTEQMCIRDSYIGVQFIYIMYSNGTLYSISKQTSEVKEIAIPTIYRPLLELSLIHS